MMRAPLPPGQYGSDEIAVGDWIDCGSAAVTAAQIDAFADLTGDRFEIHMSDAAARAHGFDARVAHGLLVLSLVDGLKNQADAQFNARASKGWDWTFKLPVLAGDTIHVRLEVTGTSSSRQPDQATLHLKFTVTNQRGDVVQTGTNRLLTYR